MIKKRLCSFIRCVCAILFIATMQTGAHAGQVEPPPDPGFENSVKAADIIVDADIIAGGPARAAALIRKVIKGDSDKVPKVIELEGFNSYNWDTVHMGFAAGSRFVLFLSRTGNPDVFSTLTPAAPRLSIQQDGVLLSLGDPPFRIPIKRPQFEEGLALILDAQKSGKVPENAETFVRGLWDAGDIEPRYFAVALAGALRDARCAPVLLEASKDKLLKLRLTALDALGRVRSPQAVEALRSLLKDTKVSVARESARVLASIQDVDSLPELLEWARKAATAKVTTSAAATQLADKAKIDAVALDILNLASNAGPLLKPETLCRSLFDIARSGNDVLARESLQVLIRLAQAPQISQLLELADDNTFDLHAAASSALRKLTLKSFRDIDEFRSWWTEAEKGFGEDMKRDRVEAAAKGLAKPDDGGYRGTVAEPIQMAPGEIALVSAAPLLLSNETANLLHADDIAAWRTPLAMPFLLERLGRDSKAERADALDGLIQLAAAHTRLKEVLWPMIRASFSETEQAMRKAAHNACGALPYPDGVDALLDAIEFHGSYEGQDAAKALYGISARTLGFSIQEPMPEQLASQKRLRGWWESSKQDFKPLRIGSGRAQLQARQLWPDMDPAARDAALEELVVANDSRQSAAAFGVLFAERDATNALWKKLAVQSRQRVRAHGLLGFLNGDASLAVELENRLKSKGENAEAPLCRALSLITMVTLKPAEGNQTRPGTAKVVAWLEAASADAGVSEKLDMQWRRMAIVALGLADNDPVSLKYLGHVIDQGLSVPPPNPDEYAPKPSDEFQLLIPAVVALCARTDGTPLLMKTLQDCRDMHLREKAARALSLRRYKPAGMAILKTLEKSSRYTWQELARAAIPLLGPGDSSALCELLDAEDASPRNAAAFILAMRPEIGVDAETRGHLVSALSDKSTVVKYYSCVAVGKRKAKSALKKLTILLVDEDSDVRSAAAEALGAIGDLDGCIEVSHAADDQSRLDSRWLRGMAIAGEPRQFELLLKLCKSNNYLDQRVGLEAMGASDKAEALEMLLKYYRNDEAASQTIAADTLSNRPGVINDIQEDLKNPDKAIRARAIHVLCHTKTPASREALEIIAKSDEDPNLRALAELGLRLSK